MEKERGQESVSPKCMAAIHRSSMLMILLPSMSQLAISGEAKGSSCNSSTRSSTGPACSRCNCHRHRRECQRTLCRQRRCCFSACGGQATSIYSFSSFAVRVTLRFHPWGQPNAFSSSGRSDVGKPKIKELLSYCMHSCGQDVSMPLDREYLFGFLVLGFAMFIAGFLTGILAIAVLDAPLGAEGTGVIAFALGFVGGVILMAIVVVTLRTRKAKA